jgi:large subunit ribosomal protein L20
MRVKRGHAKKQSHNAVLKATKGFRMSYHRLYRRAKEALLHAGMYSFRDRKKRQAQYRRNWIKSINAVCKQEGITYSSFMDKLKKNNVVLDRKILAYLAVNNEGALKQIIAESK